jgi:hypothetical protein
VCNSLNILEMPMESSFKTNLYFKRLLVFAGVTTLVLILLLTMIRSERSILTTQSIPAFNHTLNNDTLMFKFNPKWDDFAIAVKTGREVALERVPIQLLTFLSDVKNKIIIGDGPNVTIGDYEMIDVYTNLYKNIKPSIHKSKSLVFLIFKDQQKLPRELFLMKTQLDGNRTHTKTCQGSRNCTGDSQTPNGIL